MSFSGEEVKERVLGYGYDGYFNKADLSFLQLEMTVRSLLDQNRGAG